MTQLCDALCDDGNAMIVGDMNMKDDEVTDLCKSLRLRDARYVGVSFGAQGNRFDHRLPKGGIGQRYDRVLFGERVWAESHLVGNGPVCSDGSEFHLSDHCGVLAYVDVCEAYASKAKQDLVAAGLRRAQLVSLRDVSHQRELEEMKARRQQGREQQALARSRAAERDREAFQQAQRRGARLRRERRVRLRESAFGSGSLFGGGVSAVPCEGAIVPCSPQEIVIRDMSDVPRGSWESVRQVPLAGIRNIGETCYLNCVAQVLIRTPAMLEWVKRHVENGCPREHGDCVICGLKQTYDQMLSGTVGRRSVVPVIAARRQAVGFEFSHGQHDAVSFLEQFLDCARHVEVEYERYGLWGGLQQTYPVATQVDRLFGFVQETRRQCMECRGTVRSWYANEKILRVSPELEDGGPATMTELYLASCAEHETSVICPQCERDTDHRTQVRMMTAPNVLAIHVRRQAGARVPVAVEQQLDLPGFPLMELVGVVHHNGPDFHSGHYTCVCRGPGGRFWSYDDTRPVHRENKEIAHIKPKQVLLAVYARSDGAAAWTQPAVEAAQPAVAGIDEVMEVLQAEPQAAAVGLTTTPGQSIARTKR